MDNVLPDKQLVDESFKQHAIFGWVVALVEPDTLQFLATGIAMPTPADLHQSDPEERRHREIVQALQKIAEVIHSLKSEVGLLKETVKSFKPLQ